mgnify:CR=1 FL=1
MTKIIKLRGRDKKSILDIKWNHKNTQLIQTKAEKGKNKQKKKKGKKGKMANINTTILINKLNVTFQLKDRGFESQPLGPSHNLSFGRFKFHLSYVVSASATISHPKASVVPQLSHFFSCPRRWLSPTSLIRMILPPYTHTSLRFSTTHSIQSHMIIYYPVLQVTEILLFSHSVVSDSLRPHGLQHTRLPCPSPTSGAYSNSCPLLQ